MSKQTEHEPEKRPLNPYWQRIEHAMKIAGYNNANLFAKDLGLKRAENLYRIKRGDNLMSRDVAQRIHRLVPSVSVQWLMVGANDTEAETLSRERKYIETIMKGTYEAFESERFTLLYLHK